MHLNLVVGSLSTSGLLAGRKGKTHFCSLLGKVRAVPKGLSPFPVGVDGGYLVSEGGKFT